MGRCGMLVWRAKVSMGDFFFLFETLLPFARAAGERERRELYSGVWEKAAPA